MGLMDKVKEQAPTYQKAAKDYAQKAQAKVNDFQANRAAQSQLRDLGAAYYAQQTGRGTAETSGTIERIVNSLRDYEQGHGPIDLNGSSDQAPPMAS